MLLGGATTLSTLKKKKVVLTYENLLFSFFVCEISRDPMSVPFLSPVLLAIHGTGVTIVRADLAYSLSLFCMWILVLNIISVRKDLGPLVSVFVRMGADMCTFGVIWVVLLLAFSCAMHGTGINSYHRPECQGSETAKERQHITTHYNNSLHRP